VSSLSERAWAWSEVTNELPSELHFTLSFLTVDFTDLTTYMMRPFKALATSSSSAQFSFSFQLVFPGEKGWESRLKLREGEAN
jgi:hypothetical protein